MLIGTLKYLGIAFISSVLLIILSKFVLQYLIRKPADYYGVSESRREKAISIRDLLQPELPLAAANAAMEVQDYDDIKEMLQAAYDEQMSTDGLAKIPTADTAKTRKEPVPANKVKTAKEAISDEKSKTEEKTSPETKTVRKEKKPRPRPVKPSMKMRKDELIEAAAARGITVPSKATKREILDLIYGTGDHSEEIAPEKEISEKNTGKTDDKKNNTGKEKPSDGSGADGTRKINNNKNNNSNKSKTNRNKRNKQNNKNNSNNSNNNKNTNNDNKKNTDRNTENTKGADHYSNSGKNNSRKNNKNSNRSKSRNSADPAPQAENSPKEGNNQNSSNQNKNKKRKRKNNSTKKKNTTASE